MSIIKVDDLPPQGEQLIKEISEDERRRICKSFPFPRIRDRTILELRERGARIRALSEASGLGRAAIRRIVKAEKTKREKVER
jgi:hypothetical protein